MISLWAAGLEELGPSAWPRTGAARLCMIRAFLIDDRKVTRNAVFVRDVVMLELCCQSRTFAQ